MDWLAEEDDEKEEGEDERSFCCPYCWERVSPPLDEDLEGELVWDCEVCCRPWLIKIDVLVDGTRQVVVERAQN